MLTISNPSPYAATPMRTMKRALLLATLALGYAATPTDAQKLYWCEYFPEDSIRRANLDGTGVETLVTSSTSFWGVSLDLPE